RSCMCQNCPAYPHLISIGSPSALGPNATAAQPHPAPPPPTPDWGHPGLSRPVAYTGDGPLLRFLKTTIPSISFELLDFLSLAAGTLGVRKRTPTIAELIATIRNGSQDFVSNLRAEGVVTTMWTCMNGKTGVIVGEWEDG